MLKLLMLIVVRIVANVNLKGRYTWTSLYRMRIFSILARKNYRLSTIVIRKYAKENSIFQEVGFVHNDSSP